MGTSTKMAPASEQQEAGVWQLRRIGPPSTVQNSASLIRLREDGEVTVGRGPTADYFLDSAVTLRLISRVHAAIRGEKVNGGHPRFTLVNCGLNGTYINELKMGHPPDNVQVLHEGDKITFGHPGCASILPGAHAPQHDSEFQFIFECVPASRAGRLDRFISYNKQPSRARHSHHQKYAPGATGCYSGKQLTESPNSITSTSEKENEIISSFLPRVGKSPKSPLILQCETAASYPVDWRQHQIYRQQTTDSQACAESQKKNEVTKKESSPAVAVRGRRGPKKLDCLVTSTTVATAAATLGLKGGGTRWESGGSASSWLDNDVSPQRGGAVNLVSGREDPVSYGQLTDLTGASHPSPNCSLSPRVSHWVDKHHPHPRLPPEVEVHSTTIILSDEIENSDSDSSCGHSQHKEAEDGHYSDVEFVASSGPTLPPTRLGSVKLENTEPYVPSREIRKTALPKCQDNITNKSRVEKGNISREQQLRTELFAGYAGRNESEGSGSDSNLPALVHMRENLPVTDCDQLSDDADMPPLILMCNLPPGAVEPATDMLTSDIMRADVSRRPVVSNLWSELSEKSDSAALFDRPSLSPVAAEQGMVTVNSLASKLSKSNMFKSHINSGTQTSPVVEQPKSHKQTSLRSTSVQCGELSPCGQTTQRSTSVQCEETCPDIDHEVVLSGEVSDCHSPEFDLLKLCPIKSQSERIVDDGDTPMSQISKKDVVLPSVQESPRRDSPYSVKSAQVGCLESPTLPLMEIRKEDVGYHNPFLSSGDSMLQSLGDFRLTTSELPLLKPLPTLPIANTLATRPRPYLDEVFRSRKTSPVSNVTTIILSTRHRRRDKVSKPEGPAVKQLGNNRINSSHSSSPSGSSRSSSSESSHSASSQGSSPSHSRSSSPESHQGQSGSDSSLSGEEASAPNSRSSSTSAATSTSRPPSGVPTETSKTHVPALALSNSQILGPDLTPQNIKLLPESKCPSELKGSRSSLSIQQPGSGSNLSSHQISSRSSLSSRLSGSVPSPSHHQSSSASSLSRHQPSSDSSLSNHQSSSGSRPSSQHSSCQISPATNALTKTFFKDTVPNLYLSSDEESPVVESKTEIVKKIYSSTTGKHKSSELQAKEKSILDDKKDGKKSGVELDSKGAGKNENETHVVKNGVQTKVSDDGKEAGRDSKNNMVEVEAQPTSKKENGDLKTEKESRRSSLFKNHKQCHPSQSLPAPPVLETPTRLPDKTAVCKNQPQPTNDPTPTKEKPAVSATSRITPSADKIVTKAKDSAQKRQGSTSEMQQTSSKHTSCISIHPKHKSSPGITKPNSSSTTTGVKSKSALGSQPPPSQVTPPPPKSQKSLKSDSSFPGLTKLETSKSKSSPSSSSSGNSKLVKPSPSVKTPSVQTPSATAVKSQTPSLANVAKTQVPSVAAGASSKKETTNYPQSKPTLTNNQPVKSSSSSSTISAKPKLTANSPQVSTTASLSLTSLPWLPDAPSSNKSQTKAGVKTKNAKNSPANSKNGYPPSAATSKNGFPPSAATKSDSKAASNVSKSQEAKSAASRNGPQKSSVGRDLDRVNLGGANGLKRRMGRGLNTVADSRHLDTDSDSSDLDEPVSKKRDTKKSPINASMKSKNKNSSTDRSKPINTEATGKEGSKNKQMKHGASSSSSALGKSKQSKSGTKKPSKPKKRKKMTSDTSSDNDDDEDDSDDDSFNESWDLPAGVQYYDNLCNARKCLNPEGKQVDWVMCDKCEQWYHVVCVNCPIDVVLKEDAQFKCEYC